MNEKQYLATINEVIEQGSYKDNWNSLVGHTTPKWFTDARFGIFIHWGLYSVPAYDNEWYSRNMYKSGMKPFDYHIKTYGPQKDFGYKDFIPLFTAKKFNPDEWAQLFLDAGAKYVFPVAEHHDGFQMYKSDISHFNAYEMGPKRDVLGELKTAFEKKGITFCTSSHRAEHWFFMSHGKEFDSDVKEPLKRGDFYWPSMPEPDPHDLYSESPTQEYLEDWLIRTCEIIDSYKPNALYFDWWIEHSAFKPYIKKMAAYYYNRAEQWGSEVVINYKHDAFMFGTAVVEIERGKFAEQKPYPWQTDTAAARNSWCYTVNNEYKSSCEILCDLVDIVSKNGNMLLNIGPKADGTIPQEDAKILREIGAWLKVNGEAIYETKLWRKFGEGPTEVKEGQFSDSSAGSFTAQDIRFTVNGSFLYATALKCPENGTIMIQSLAEQDAQFLPVFHGIIKGISVLGFDEKPSWRVTQEGLIITTKTVKSDYPIVYKIEID